MDVGDRVEVALLGAVRDERDLPAIGRELRLEIVPIAVGHPPRRRTVRADDPDVLAAVVEQAALIGSVPRAVVDPHAVVVIGLLRVAHDEGDGAAVR